MQNANVKINEKQITSKITERFNYDKIINETYYIRRMSPRFTIKLEILLKDHLLKDVPVNQATRIIQNVPFFKLINSHVQICYQNPDRVLIISGIRKEKIKEWLGLWSNEVGKRTEPIRNVNLGSWHFLEFSDPEWASIAQRFLRGKKGEVDLQEIEKKSAKDKKETDCFSYKIPSRRVRIILLSQDFFKVLFDIITENMKQKFNEAIDSKNGPQPFRGYVYVPIYTNQKTEEKQDQFEDAASSEFLSQTSSAYDHSVRIKEIDVQTSNQGTQIEIIGTQLQTQIKQPKLQSPKVDVGQQAQNKSDVDQEKREVSQQISLPTHSQQKQGEKIVHKAHHDNETHKNRANSMYCASAESLKKSKCDSRNRKQKKQRNHDKSQEFPSLPSHKQAKHEEGKKDRSQSYSCLQFCEIKKKLKLFMRQHQQCLAEPDIPNAIRRQTESIMFKHKFMDGVIQKYKQEKIDRDDIEA